MAIKRRQFILDDGEELLLSRSAVGVADRFDEFLRTTGLEGDDVFSHPLLATPLPIYRKGSDGELQRFAAVSPAIIWHPVFWLPATLALRYQVQEADGEQRVETDAEWAVRVGLELQAAALYDAHSGGWLDILALHGVDIENPVDYARVEAWLAGNADETLDGIDLGELTENPEPDWAFQPAAELLAALEPAQWSVTAASLLETLTTTPRDEHTAQRLNLVVAQLANAMLYEVPGRSADLDDLVEVAENPDNAADVEQQLTETLTAVADDYSYAVEALDE